MNFPILPLYSFLRGNHYFSDNGFFTALIVITFGFWGIYELVKPAIDKKYLRSEALGAFTLLAGAVVFTIFGVYNIFITILAVVVFLCTVWYVIWKFLIQIVIWRFLAEFIIWRVLVKNFWILVTGREL
jgi:hypothetical protein